MAFRIQHRQSLHNADGRGKMASVCGDSIEFFLVIKDQRIASITYDLNGCMNTNASANAVIDLVEGLSLKTAWALSPDEVYEYLESLPEDHFHCAELAVSALRLALADAGEKRRAPWKKKYQ